MELDENAGKAGVNLSVGHLLCQGKLVVIYGLPIDVSMVVADIRMAVGDTTDVRAVTVLVTIRALMSRGDADLRRVPHDSSHPRATGIQGVEPRLLSGSLAKGLPFTIPFH